MKDNETPAIGKKGCLLYSPFTGKHFFRIYDEEKDENGRKNFIDYHLCAEDIDIEIQDSSTSLYVEIPQDSDPKNKSGEGRLDWSSKTLGREK